MLYFNYKYVTRLVKRSALPLTAVAAFLYSCASVGTLGGGDYDETPPKFLKGAPAPNELNASRKRVSIEFDEYLKLDKPQEKIVISPPQVQQANVRASGTDEKARIIPPVIFSLEEALEWIKADEYVEVTPQSIRMRKIILDHLQRKRAGRD